MMEIKTFGLAESLKQPCNLVSKNIITRDNRSLRITALVVLHICDAICSQHSRVVLRQYPHLMHLNLPDGEEKGGITVDLLIGADHNWSMVSRQLLRREMNPITIDTRVGWVDRDYSPFPTIV